MSVYKDPFSRIEWFIFRLSFVLFLLYELVRFGKYLYESW
jgi:hypothetical protein